MIENPILRGFCPDPSIVRAGEDFFIATSALPRLYRRSVWYVLP